MSNNSIQEGRKLLEALHNEVKGLIELRFLKGVKVKRRFCKSLNEVNWNEIERDSQDQWNTYFSVCSRKEEKGTKDAIYEVPALFADLDGKNFTNGKKEAFQQFHTNLPQHLFPSIIVNTGNGYHAYWLLKQPYLVENKEDVSEVEGYIKGLALVLNADTIHDLSRVLRIPGTANWKDPNHPLPCHIVQFDSTKRFSFFDFQNYWVEIKAGKEKASFSENLPQVELSDLEIPRHFKNLIVNGDTQGKYKSRSECDEAVILALLRGGYDKDTIKVIFANEQWKIGEKFRQKGDHGLDYLSNSIANAKIFFENAKKQSLAIKEKTTGKGEVEAEINCPQLAREIMRDYWFRTLKDTEEILFYDQGVYKYSGETKIKEETGIRLGDYTTAHRVNEVLNLIRISTYVDREEFNKSQGILNVKNGFLELESKRLKPHSPSHLSTLQIPVPFNPNANSPNIDKFFSQVLPSSDINLISELFGYCLEPSYWLHKAFMFLGDGSNGKSTLINLLQKFLGRQNCATSNIQEMEKNKYSVAELYGKLANLCADIPSTAMEHISYFKMLCGEDLIYAEQKFKHPFSFTNHAKLIFSANRPPKVYGEDTYAFWSRWILVNFPNKFPPNDPTTDKHILEKLTSESELSGLLNLALAGLSRLYKKQDFSYGKTIEQTEEEYLRSADSIYAFIEDKCELKPSAWISKEGLFKAYKNYCAAHKIPTMNKEAFGRSLKRSPYANVTSQRSSTGNREMGWQGIKLI